MLLFFWCKGLSISFLTGDGSGGWEYWFRSPTSPWELYFLIQGEGVLWILKWWRLFQQNKAQIKVRDRTLPPQLKYLRKEGRRLTPLTKFLFFLLTGHNPFPQVTPLLMKGVIYLLSYWGWGWRRGIYLRLLYGKYILYFSGMGLYDLSKWWRVLYDLRPNNRRI